MAKRPHPAIGQAENAHRTAIVGTLALAFADDPAMSWIMPDRVDRARRLPRLFDRMVDEDLADGWCLASPECEAATLWRTSAASHSSLLGLLRGLPGYLGALGPNLLRALAVSNAIETHHPHGIAYDYLHIAGVHPDFQGQGWGGAAIRAGLDRARQGGRAVYLETATESNVGLYQRLGFAVTKEWNVPRGGPHFWSMLWNG